MTTELIVGTTIIIALLIVYALKVQYINVLKKDWWGKESIPKGINLEFDINTPIISILSFGLLCFLFLFLMKDCKGDRETQNKELKKEIETKDSLLQDCKKEILILTKYNKNKNETN